jgi:hypothetical protein
MPVSAAMRRIHLSDLMLIWKLLIGMLGGKNRAFSLIRGIDLAENDAYCP